MMADAEVLLSSIGQVPGWGYLLIFAITAVQLIPNGSVVMASAALAGQGGMSFPLLACVVLAGMLTGDLLLYGLVCRVRPRAGGRLARCVPRRLRARLARLLAGAADHVHRNGVGMVVTLRFVPGGRATGATAAGLGRYPLRRYLTAAALAEAAWTSLYVTIGYTGGKIAPGPLVAVATAFAMGGAVGLTGLLLRRRRRPAAPTAGSAHAAGAAPAPELPPATALVAAKGVNVPATSP